MEGELFVQLTVLICAPRYGRLESAAQHCPRLLRERGLTSSNFDTSSVVNEVIDSLLAYVSERFLDAAS